MKNLICLLVFLLPAFFNAQGQSFDQSSTYAVVIGVSNYLDADFLDLKYARRDAEAYTDFLQSKSGGAVPKENIKLLTDAYATNARIQAALDWLIENSYKAERVIIYFAGYGDTDVSPKDEPRYFFPSDVPAMPLRAGTFEIEQIAGLIDMIAGKTSSDFLFIANLYPLVFSANNLEMTFHGKNASAPFFKHKLVFKTESVENPDLAANFKTPGITNNHLLLDGLLGFADRNYDEEITLRELRHFLKKSKKAKERQPGLLFVAARKLETVLSKMDVATFEALKKQTGNLFPSLIELETGEKEDRILKTVSEDTRLLYHDFVMAVKLGNLLFPKGQSADAIYEKLIQKTELKKLHSDMRRKLAAALQDEVQQALNAYLKLDNRELESRNKDLEIYRQYTSYLARSMELFGNSNFMNHITEAKYEYFSGLVLRMEAVRNKRPELLDQAIESQHKALELIPEASFVYNELGVIFSYKKDWESAKTHFQNATEFSPSWGIPYSNLGNALANLNDYEKAIEAAIKGFQKSPKNIYVTNSLASVYLQAGDLYSAGRACQIVLEKDPKNLTALYNMACIQALSGNPESALSFLEKALTNGFDDFVHLAKDSDLDSLKSREEFSLLINRFSKN